MSPLQWKGYVTAIASLTCSLVLAAGLLAAQTSTQSPSTAAERAAARRAAAQAAAAKRAAARTGSARATTRAAGRPTANSSTSPAQTAPAASQLTSSGAPSGTVPSRTQPGAATSGNSPRSATSGSYTSGLGTFLAGQWTLTAYGCYRSGARLFCDFDLSSRNNSQANANLYYPVKLVDDGGRMTARHTAFYLGTDGSQLSNVFVSSGSPVRMIMEYDNVPQSDSSVSLVFRTDRIEGVPVTAANSGPSAGTIPARGAATSQGQAAGAEPKAH